MHKRIYFVERCLVIILLLALIRNAKSHIRSKTDVNEDSQFEIHNRKIIQIPTMVHIDKPLALKFKRQNNSRIYLKNTVMNILRKVERNFRLLTSAPRITLNIIGVQILRNTINGVEPNRNGYDYLNNYCGWQHEKKLEKGWFYSILLTGLDLYYESNGVRVRSSAGRSYSGGVCSTKYSCVLVEYSPMNSAFIITHEMGHSLGLPHDGEERNKCKSKGYIMGAQYCRRRHPINWSPYSLKRFRTFLRSKKASCLKPS